MATYHQMGYQSENLLFETQLRGYAGAILSPINSDQQKMTVLAERCGQTGDYEIIFDPQLYYPNCEVEKLRSWPYFPDNFATIDAASDEWWRQLVSDIASVLGQIQPTSVCSPAFVPRSYPDSYFSQMTKISEMMSEAVAPLGIDVLQTVIVPLSELTDLSRVAAISSVLTRREVKRVYMVFVQDSEPRRESTDTEGLKGAMRLIALLEQNALQVLVGFCSSDIVLWKAAGASSCATGKFWNLRRFTASRWNPEEAGGGQLAYWLEESLMAALRESDILRIEQAGMISTASQNNPFSQEILELIHSNGETAWVGLGWRQYLNWFHDIDTRISEGLDLAKLLRTADQNWEKLEDLDLLMEERRNDGRWIRPWRRAIAEFRQAS